MKTLGLLGGMSWESSAHYYRIINQQVMARLGAPHSATCLLWSMDFAEIETLQHAGEWSALSVKLVAAAQKLALAGAEGLVICTNTMHRMADEIAAGSGLPLIHIADATGQAVREAGLHTVGLLGTAFTMEQAFYIGRLRERFGLQVLVPDAPGRQRVHDIIYQELVSGVVLARSREVYQKEIAALIARGAQGIILGCTEIMLLIGQQDSPVPVFDTTALHAHAAVDWMLAP
ncbi:aspartate/glutamate racemase family protein [Pantoea sp. 1.19]|uniref:aspartate/glutamate racemase family protein n=1 Tax=Pantoea sp. 1.19 TaxID=1925589 RepID=UPI00094914EF|nr:aspartate/glutamate racemase family protein [Pantoea sp. 1.19]